MSRLNNYSGDGSGVFGDSIFSGVSNGFGDGSGDGSGSGDDSGLNNLNDEFWRVT